MLKKRWASLALLVGMSVWLGCQDLTRPMPNSVYTDISLSSAIVQGQSSSSSFVAGSSALSSSGALSSGVVLSSSSAVGFSSVGGASSSSVAGLSSSVNLSSSSSMGLSSGTSSSAVGPQMQLTVGTSNFGPPCETGTANVAVVWVEKADGSFVRTLKLFAGIRMKYLASWRTSSSTTTATGTSSIDGWSGATRSSYTDIVASWDLKNKAGALVPDGAYVLKMSGACGNFNDQAKASASFNLSQGVLTPGTSSDPVHFSLKSWTLK